jgi:hypothetical protein
MSTDGPDRESLEEMLRSIADELGRYIERSVENVDLDELAEATGVDLAAARSWLESAGSWLRAHSESLGEELAHRVAGSRGGISERDLLGGAAPHPLDLPTEEQGLALAALDSGRWGVEPGSDMLAPKGDGPGPTDAIGIVRELRVRDWIGTDGELTLVGRHALSRWLEAVSHR